MFRKLFTQGYCAVTEILQLTLKKYQFFENKTLPKINLLERLSSTISLVNIKN